MNKGWISLHRKFLNWEWYKDINVKSLFIHCLLNANFEDKSWRGIIIKRGDFFTSINHLSFDLNLTIKQIRTALKKLEKTNEISIKGASNGTMVTICKYDDYQEIEKQKGKRRANEGQAKGKQRATTNNYNKDNNVNNENKTLAKNEFLPEREILNQVYELFDFKIIENLTNTEKNKWLDTINKLNRLDNYSFEEILKTIVWGKNDTFWNSNFHSIAGLRKKNNGITKFFQINKKMNYEQTAKNGNGNKQIEDIRKIAESIENDPDLI